MMNSSNLKLVVILTLIFIATLFLIQNTQVVNINILVWTYYMSVSLVVVSTLIVGILVGWFFNSYLSHKKKKQSDNENYIETD
jgi:uncharacterized integral membrane protein